MIVLLGCSISLSANNNDVDATNPSTGERVQSKDSVLIAYDDLRIVNSKLMELDYEKQINDKLRLIIDNDSIAMNTYKILNERTNRDCQRAIRQRNIAICGAATFLVTTIIALFMK